MKTTNFSAGYLLSRLVYGYKAYRSFVYVSGNKQIRIILDLLIKKGLIFGYRVEKAKKKNNYIIFLKYFEGRPLFRSFRIFSCPSKRVYVDYKSLKKLSVRRLVVLSTNRGFLSLIECRSLRIGGELLFEIF